MAIRSLLHNSVIFLPITNKLTRIEGILNFIWINILYLLDAHVRMRSHQFNLSKLCTWTILSFAIRHSRFLDLSPRHVCAHKSLIYLRKYLQSWVLQGYKVARKQAIISESCKNKPCPEADQGSINSCISDSIRRDEIHLFNAMIISVHSKIRK